MSDQRGDGDRELSLRFDGTCTSCRQVIPKGARAIYVTSAKSVRHITCPGTGIDPGVAGASAMREYERRKARDDAIIAAQRANVRGVFGDGVIGKIAAFLAVDDSPRRTTAVWKQGAVGEERVGARLDALAEVGVVTLHDRRIPGTRANIDHLVVTPWAVWVIDPKRYLHKRPELVVTGGLFSARVEHLKVGGRDKDDLVEGVLWQVKSVESALGGQVPVSGAMCFVEGDWPLIGGAFSVRGVQVFWPGRLAKTLLRTEQPTIDVESVTRVLAAKFPPA